MLGAVAGPGQAIVGASQAIAAEPATASEVEAAPFGGSNGTFGPGGAGPRVEVSGVGVERPRHGALRYSAPTETGDVEQRDGATPQQVAELTSDQLASTPKNAPCPCGSGKKFKMCHGRR
ncbi:MAG: SEC-C metal-binding domain-containing protein [Dermatophilaceae bacterium]